MRPGAGSPPRGSRRRRRSVDAPTGRLAEVRVGWRNELSRANRPARRSASWLAQLKEGARAPKRCVRIRKRTSSISPPAPVLCQCRGCNVIVNGPSVPPGGFQGAGLSSFRTSGGCAARTSSRAAARRASVQGVATVARPRSTAPESETSYLATTLRTESNAASTGPPTLPRFRRSAAASLCRARLRGVWGWRGERGQISREMFAPFRHARGGEHPRKV